MTDSMWYLVSLVAQVVLVLPEAWVLIVALAWLALPPVALVLVARIVRRRDAQVAAKGER